MTNAIREVLAEMRDYGDNWNITHEEAKRRLYSWADRIEAELKSLEHATVLREILWGVRDPVTAKESEMSYKCVNGHDLCNQMYASPEYLYCEKVLHYVKKPGSNPPPPHNRPSPPSNPPKAPTRPVETS